MPNRTSISGSELFIVDNSDTDWKALRYLHDWCQISKGFDIATGYFEIGALLGLKEEWRSGPARRDGRAQMLDGIELTVSGDYKDYNGNVAASQCGGPCDRASFPLWGIFSSASKPTES